MWISIHKVVAIETVNKKSRVIMLAMIFKNFFSPPENWNALKVVTIETVNKESRVILMIFRMENNVENKTVPFYCSRSPLYVILKDQAHFPAIFLCVFLKKPVWL